MASGSGIPSIAQMWEEKDVEGLIEALGHHNGFVRSGSANALGDFGDVRAVDPLIGRWGTVTSMSVRTLQKHLARLAT